MSRPHSHVHSDKSKLVSSSGQWLLIFSITTIKMHLAWIASKTKHVFPTIKQTIKGKESSDSNRSNSLLIVGKTCFALLAKKVFCISTVAILNIKFCLGVLVYAA